MPGAEQTSVLADVCVGAPPDEFNPAGQDWGLAPFNPAALAASDFAALRELMRSAMRHAGAIRLDHVLGLKRVFMIPRGSRAADGAYVRFPFEPSLHAIARGKSCGALHRHRRRSRHGAGGLSRNDDALGPVALSVMLFEREGDGRFRPPEAYPAEALATFNTHDLPSLRGWLDAHDLRTKRDLGLDPGESDEARAGRNNSSANADLDERAPDTHAERGCDGPRAERAGGRCTFPGADAVATCGDRAR